MPPHTEDYRGENTYAVFTRPSVVLLFLMVVIIPFSVHAGVFSAIMGVNPAPTEEQIEYEANSNAQTMPLLRAAIHADPNPAKGGGDIIVDGSALLPGGEISDEPVVNSKTANGEISVYVVRENDTLSQIAEMFGINSKTILWANDIKNGIIHPGDTLVILPITGIRHVVAKGDTISTIAKKYEADEKDILDYNQLADASSISIGDTIVVPGGTMAAPPLSKTATAAKTSGGGTSASGGGSGSFSHPVPGAVRSQGIHGYNGVDLAAPVGTPVLSALGGTVIVAKASGWNGGYGNYIVVKHANGTQTLYAHLSGVFVESGQTVGTGARIGSVGNTGRSTGAHLHFEVRGARNPF